jgi:hypothetical protein
MLYPDYEEFVASLNARGVRYLIVGAHAVAYHARPRASKDLDVVVAPGMANARRTVRAVCDFFGGTAPRYASPASVADPELIIQLGVAPVRIDIITDLATTSFTKAYNRRVEGVFGETSTHYISLADLIAEKQHWGRPQDIADVVVLERSLRAARSRARK